MPYGMPNSVAKDLFITAEGLCKTFRKGPEPTQGQHVKIVDYVIH